MYDYDSLDNRIKKVIAECESLMDCFETSLKADQNGLPSQLKEIEKTIENMQRKNLTIPPELRKLKLDLLSGCDAVEKQNDLKTELIENMTRIFSIKKANIKKKQASKKRTIRKSNCFPPNETLCRFSFKNQTYRGRIKGRQLLTDGYGVFSSFSSASVKITQTSRNGWRDWELMVPGSNRWILADIWRKIKK